MRGIGNSNSAYAKRCLYEHHGIRKNIYAPSAVRTGNFPSVFRYLKILSAIGACSSIFHLPSPVEKFFKMDRMNLVLSINCSKAYAFLRKFLLYVGYGLAKGCYTLGIFIGNLNVKPSRNYKFIVTKRKLFASILYIPLTPLSFQTIAGIRIFSGNKDNGLDSRLRGNDNVYCCFSFLAFRFTFSLPRARKMREKHCAWGHSLAQKSASKIRAVQIIPIHASLSV